MRAWLVKAGGLTALGVVSLLVALALTLPMRLIAEIAEAQGEKALGFAYDIEIGGARLSPLLGVRLREVTLTPRQTDADTPPTPFEVDSLRVNVSPLSAFGGLRARAEARSGDGRMRVTLSPGDEGGNAVRVELFEFNLSAIRPLQRAIGIPVAGAVSGTIDLAYNDERQLSGGNIEVGIAGLVFGPGELHGDWLRQIGGVLPMPRTDLGDLVLRAPLDAGRIQIDELRATGDDIQFEASGDVQLRNPTPTSRLNVAVQLRLEPAYVEEAGLGAALALPGVSRLQSGDAYSMALSGPLQRPSVVPAARSRGPR
ncbi:MAG: type II secretion system protein GspN [Myxococcales bacterium]|nr:type II secretion system protein GspN [Myxococcales bacterium]MCB9520053.1 type II secretion system protein GspN [Myxococcales bacterium]